MKLTTTTILAAAILAGSACKKKSNTKVDDPGRNNGSADRTLRDRSDVDRDKSSLTTVSADDGNAPPSFAAVYFEFDSTTLSPGARSELGRLGEWLASHPKARITIEGHADERGTDEYNVALGQKRAQAIQEYLGRLGIERARLQTISYGEERPAVAGDGEDAWAQNRRGEFVER